MKILVAASADSEAKASIDVAATFPWPEGSQIHVLSVSEVVQPIMVGMVPDAMDVGELQVPTMIEAQSASVHFAQQFRGCGLEAEGFSAIGDPETEILEHARQWGADLIVVGSHNRSAIDKFLTGSTSESVVKHAPCSVLVLKHVPTR